MIRPNYTGGGGYIRPTPEEKFSVDERVEIIEMCAAQNMGGFADEIMRRCASVTQCRQHLDDETRIREAKNLPEKIYSVDDVRQIANHCAAQDCRGFETDVLLKGMNVAQAKRYIDEVCSLADREEEREERERKADTHNTIEERLRAKFSKRGLNVTLNDIRRFRSDPAQLLARLRGLEIGEGEDLSPEQEISLSLGELGWIFERTHYQSRS